MAAKIRYIEGIPRWFVRLHHWVAKWWYCRKGGHRNSGGEPAILCVQCGQFLPPLDRMADPNAYVNDGLARLDALPEEDA